MPAVFLTALGLSALRPIDDADFWWLLRAGRYMVETRSFPHHRSVLGDGAGRGLAEPCLGLRAPHLRDLHALAGTTGRHPPPGPHRGSPTCSVLYRPAPARGPRARVVHRAPGHRRARDARLLVAAARSWSRTLILALFVSVLADYQAGRGNRLWWLPLLTAVWANLHAGFLSGPLLVALAAAGELGGWVFGDDTGRAGGLARARGLAFWAAAECPRLASEPVPLSRRPVPLSGDGGDGCPRRGSASGRRRRSATPKWSSSSSILGLFLLLALGTAQPIPWRDLIVLVPLVHLGLTGDAQHPAPDHRRDADPGPGGRLVRPDPLASPRRARPPRDRGGDGRVWSCPSCTMVAGSRRPARVWSAFRPTFGVADSLPSGAAEFLRREGRRGTLWNEYVWGGFLIWHLYPELRVSIDGRMARLRPACGSREHLAVSELEPGWQDVLARLDPTAAVVRSGSPLVSALRAAGWAVRYEDGVATVLDPPGRSG